MVTVIGLLAGCGYQFQGTGSVLPPDVKKVYIPLAENSTTDAQLTPMITEAIRDRFDQYGAVEVVDNLNDADAVLRTRILKVKRNTASVTSNTDIALQFDVTLTLAAELRRVTGPVLWRNTSLSVTKSIGATSNSVVTTSADFATSLLNASDVQNLGSREVTRNQEQTALNALAGEAARQIYDAAVAPDF
jgi:outer membrane lipopolysaccharide assembly protein LptE/RlpB